MGRVLKYIIYLMILCGVALAGYAALFALPAPQTEVVVPVTPPVGE